MIPKMMVRPIAIRTRNSTRENPLRACLQITIQSIVSEILIGKFLEYGAE
jgi:hypothetical protein